MLANKSYIGFNARNSVIKLMLFVVSVVLSSDTLAKEGYPEKEE